MPNVQFVRALDLRLGEAGWPYAEARRAEIADAWARWSAENPALFDGEVLIQTAGALEGDVFRGVYARTRFSAFLHFLRSEQPDGATRNAFSLAALTGADGALVMGVMSAHTANAGKVYFPGGTPDASDIVDGKVDLTGSVMRELREETGLLAAEVEPEPGFMMVEAPLRRAFLKILRSPLPGEALRAAILARVAEDPTPELADVAVIAGLDDPRIARMPPFQAAYARWWFEIGITGSRSAS